MVKDWKGQTIVCIGSGPSLTKEDCELVERSGFKTIAVNNAWVWAKFCEVIYAADPGWWKHNIKEITIDAERWTCFKNVAENYNLKCHGPFNGAISSGLRALQLAIESKAKKVILLGYDNSVAKGIHFHGKHEKTGNPDKAKCKSWEIHFSILDTKNCEVVNCSRYTELNCFKKSNLEKELC